jgi:hypothetical protein
VQRLFELHVGLMQAVATVTDGCFGMWTAQAAAQYISVVK